MRFRLKNHRIPLIKASIESIESYQDRMRAQISRKLTAEKSVHHLSPATAARYQVTSQRYPMARGLALQKPNADPDLIDSRASHI